MRAISPFAVVWLLHLAALVANSAESLPLKNADFSQWQGGLLLDWKIAVGAISVSDTPSRLKQVADGGIELSGDAATGQWRVVSQRVALQPGGALRLLFEARTADLKREARQYDNCYVGLSVLDGAGKRVAFAFRNLFETKWAPGQVTVHVPAGATSADVTIFLSKSGSLAIRDLRLEQLDQGDSFDVLVDELDRYYSFFALKQFDWRKRAADYAQAARAAKSPAEFVVAVQPLLAELKDLHVTLEAADGKVTPSFVSAADSNFDARTISARLTGVKQLGRLGFTGRTAEGFGYVALGSLTADERTAAEMLAAFDALLDAKGLIIDLRVNAGGSERFAQQFISRLIDQPLPYAKNQFRGGAAHDDFLLVGTRQVTPNTSKTYRGPVVGLIGPRCVSSGEGMALMIKALPQGKLLGQPTRGASGNPQPVALPNGVTVRYSTWLPLDMEGWPFEGRGIEPAARIDDDPTGVKGLDAAIAELQQRQK
jgi:hypothetical protein